MVSREEALRLCTSVPVVVEHSVHGYTSRVPFGPDSPYYSGNGPYLYSTLRYYAAKGTQSQSLKPKGRIPPPPRDGSAEAAGEAEAPASPAESEQEPPRIRITKLDCECFAPMVDTVLIHYAIEGDLAEAESVHLRIATQVKPEQYLLDRKLDGVPQAKGIFMWDGRVSDGSYPGCVNLASSPYWVQLGLAAKSGSPRFTNKAPIRVELLQTELTVRDASGLGEEPENAEMLARLTHELKQTPQEGTLHLPGTLFKVHDQEMYDSTFYRIYGERLKEGLGVPLFVKLWVKGKDGTRKRAPQAVTGTPILWDAVPDDEGGLDANLSERGAHPEAKKFLKGVGGYKQDKTEPKGYTAHWELGGIRAVERARKNGRQQWKSLDGSWDGSAPKQRNWAGRSRCAKIPNAVSDSGMLYYNGRIAGDRYRVTVYADLDGSLDDKERDLAELAPAERKSATVGFRNWRDVVIGSSFRIGAGTAPISFEGPNREFRKAALDLVPKPGLLPAEIGEQWKTAYRKALPALAMYGFIKDAAMEDPGTYPVRYSSFSDYWERSHPDAGFFGKIWHRIKSFFGALDDKDFRKKCDDHAYLIYTEAAKYIPAAAEGLICFKFGHDGEHNHVEGTFTAGIAPEIFGYGRRTRAVLFIFRDGQSEDTVIHEVGHQLFLAHAPGHWEPGKNPDGAAPALHDRSQICLMSYHPDGKYFCGLCLARMAGWDNDLIKNDGTVLDLFASV